jgi:hypothetical protein
MTNTQRHFYSLLLGVTALGLTACTTMTEYNCSNSTDWYKVAHNSASMGERSDISNLQKTCPQKMTKENSEAYLKGYNEQIANYCKPDYFRYLGENDQWGNWGSCPAERQSELTKANSKGRDISSLNWRIQRIESELKSDTITDKERETLEKESNEKKAKLATLTE